MTREEIKALDMDALEKRANEIAVETAEASMEALEALTAEIDAIEERKAEIKRDADEKRAKMLEVLEGAGEVIVEKKEERKMDPREVRKSAEYIDAYVEYVKKGYDLERLGAEKRALLTENAGEGGTIAVPVYIEDRIQTAWENDEIMRRVRRTFFAGNLKVGAEVSASPAVVHAEGAEAISEEELVITYIDLIPEYIKKMVRVSHTAMALRGTAFLDYLYDELEYQIVKLAAANVVAAMAESSLAATSDLAGATPTAADIIQAEGLLSAEATNPVIITTRAIAADLKAAALSANYGYDPFDGLPVLYTEAANLGDASFIVADLSGVQANFPEGDGVRFIFDEYTEAPANIVRIVGRLLVAIAVVGPGKVVVAGPASA